MTKPLLSLKWLDDDVKQVEIEIRDGKEPSRIVYPKPKDIEESQYEYARGEFFLRIRDRGLRSRGTFAIALHLISYTDLPLY